MTRLILSGCNGAMGRVIAAHVRERSDCAIVAGIDINTDINNGFHVFSNAADCTAPADVIIDFSHPRALEPLLEAAVLRGLPLVVATTGLSREHIALIHKSAKKVPIFFSFNMSLGVNLMVELAKTAARVLGDGFDVEIIEKHHNKKIDAPSGTALMLANGVSEALSGDSRYIYDRHSQMRPRSKNEIGIHSVRAGAIVGEHEIVFAGKDEIITISHSAHSKQVFAAGAVNAAIFLADKAAGLYDMSNLI